MLRLLHKDVKLLSLLTSLYNMKYIFTLIFLIVTNLVFSQEVETIIYIDNSISVHRASKLASEVEKVIEESNGIGSLIMGDANKDGKLNHKLYDLENDNLIDDLSSICLQERQTQRPQVLKRVIETEIRYNDLVKSIDGNSKQIIPIDLHLFLNASTFVLKKIYTNVIERLIVDLKLTDERFNCTIHLDYPKEKEQYTESIDEIKNKRVNIKINQY
jgi:hypothetical protein